MLTRSSFRDQPQAGTHPGRPSLSPVPQIRTYGRLTSQRCAVQVAGAGSTDSDSDSLFASHAPSLGTHSPGRTPACSVHLPLQPSSRLSHSLYAFSKALALPLLYALIPIILGNGEEVELKRGLEQGLFPSS